MYSNIIRNEANIIIWIVIPVSMAIIYPYIKNVTEYLEWLSIAIMIYVLFFSVVIHELCHGLAAYACGDTTAKDAGRLTLNPVRHVSIVGTIIVPIILYFVNPATVLGWAKPVPFEPVNMRKHPRDQVFLAVAGPLSNFALSYLFFILFLISAFIFNNLFPDNQIQMMIDIFTPAFFENVSFEGFWFVLFKILNIGILLNVILGVFNLIPFPPLDGFWILKSTLPKKAMVFMGKLQIIGFVLLIIALQFDLIQVLFYPTIIALEYFVVISSLCLG